MYLKKIAIISVLCFVFSALVPSLVLAKANLTVVRGNLYDLSNGGRIANNNVELTCQGKISPATVNVTTDGNGLYTYGFDKTECPKYSFVTAVTSFDGDTQTQTVQVSDRKTATLDFYFGEPVSVPEFGMLPGILAAVTSVGVYVRTLKRNK